MYDFDHQLFLGLNFDGGPVVDRLMLTVSGTAMWLPLYALILWLVWRRGGWRNVIVFTVLMIAALAAQGSSRITHTEFIDRGYADFAQKLTALGGQIARETPRGADCPKKRTSKT